MKSLVGGSVAALLLVTCDPALAAPDAPDPVAAGTIAPDALTQSIQSYVKMDLGKVLKDPYSAVWEFQPLRRGSCMTGLFSKYKRTYGWAVEFTVNAKNSFGGYGGTQPYTALFYDENRNLVIYEGAKYGMMGHHGCRFEIDAAPSRTSAPPTAQPSRD